MKPKIAILYILFFYCSIIGWAQNNPGDYLFNTLKEDLALSNSNVLSILKDSEGYMWFGTANGLNRFDGTKIKSFYSDDRDSSALSNEYILRIFEGPEKNLWVKNVNGILEVYLPQEEIFDRNIGNYAVKYGLKSDRISKIYKDNHRFWFVHPDEGVSIYDDVLDETIFLRADTLINGSISSNQVSSVTKSIQGEYWVIHQNGVIDIVEEDNWKVIDNVKIGGLLDPSIVYEFEIFIDSKRDAWVYAPDQSLGLIHIDYESRQISSIHEKSTPLRLNNNMVKGLIENGKGEIWVGTDHGGINVINKRRGTVKYIVHDPEISRSLSHNAIYALYKDSEDIVWVGTYKDGVNYYHQGLMSFTHVRKGFSSESSLPFNDVNVFVEDSLGNLYIGTNGDGLYYHDRINGTYKRFAHDSERSSSISGDVIVDLAIDKDGVLWIGTYLNGLCRYDGKEFKRYMPEVGNPSSLSDINVWKIYIDRKNRVWVGTLRGGLNLWDRKNENFVHFPVSGEPFKMNNQFVSSFAEDREGNLWVGGGYGIDVINLETGYHKYYSTGESGLMGNNITDLMLDSHGVMWVTTSQGLNYFEAKKKNFVGFSAVNGLPSDYLVSILEDGYRNFWLSTQNGLSYSRVDRSSEPYTLNFLNFDETDGLQAALFNKNAAYKTRDGEFIFGGPNGYNIFRSENFSFSQNDPKVIFTGFQLFNQPLERGQEIGGRVLLEKSITYTNHISLKHYENIFSVEFSALNFIHLEKNKFRYKLKGFNEDWISLSEPPFRVNYTNLDPGSYQLIVQPAKNDGQWSQQESSFWITIQPPFWKTPLAYLIYVVTAVLLIILARKLLLDKERENFRRIEEKIEAQRIQELDKLKTRFFTNISHEFRTPLTLILAPIEKLLQNPQSPEHTNQYQTIERNGKRLLRLVNQLLDVKNIEKEGHFFNPAEGDIISFIEDRVCAFADLSERKQIQLVFESDIVNFPTQFDADKLEKIIFNILSNAFKFIQNEGMIKVRVGILEKTGEIATLQIRIKDTGIGIPEQDLPKIFDRYFTSNSKENMMNQGSGIGLSLAMEFAKLHGGEIKVESKTGMGAEFFILLRLPFLFEKGQSKIKQIVVNEIDPKSSIVKSSKPVILLVEDNEEFRYYLAESLSDDYEVLMAENGRQGLEKAREWIPDLVVSDLMMPYMDGISLCQEIKKDIKTSHIPVIILTANNSEKKHLEGLESGSNLFITKPFQVDILFSSIRNLLQERERLQIFYRKKISVHASEQEIESLDDQLIKRAIQIVEDHLEEPEFSVELMSKDLGMSRVHLYKKLSSLTGKSPVEFIRLIRLQKAAQLLGTSQLTVSEIAYKVGYNNAKYFSKHFKLEFGLLPSLFASNKDKIIEYNNQDK